MNQPTSQPSNSLTDQDILQFLGLNNLDPKTARQKYELFMKRDGIAPDSLVEWMAKAIAKDIEKTDHPSEASINSARQRLSSVLAKGYNNVIAQEKQQ